MPEVARQFWREVARQTRPILASSRRLPRAIRRLPAVPVWQPPCAQANYVRGFAREVGLDGVRRSLGGIRSPFASRSAVPTTVIVTHGDSITSNTTSAGTSVYPNYLKTYVEARQSTRVNLIQRGVSGSSWNYDFGATVPTLIADATTQVDPYASATAKLGLFAGTNGLKLGGNTPAQEYAAFETYLAARLAAGWVASNIYVLTMLPRENYSAANVTSYNNLLIAGAVTYGYNIVRVHENRDFGIDGKQSDTNWFYDQIHPTPAAHQQIAETIYDKLYTTGWANGTWGPVDFGGLVLWLDANVSGSFTLTGSNVDAWADQSGAGIISSLAGVTTTRPAYSAAAFNSKPGINLDGADDRLDKTGISGFPQTVAFGVAARFANLAVENTVFDFGNSNGHIIGEGAALYHQTTLVASGFGGTLSIPALSDTASSHTMIGAAGRNRRFAVIDNAVFGLDQKSAAADIAVTNFRLGRMLFGSFWPMNGTIHEVVLSSTYDFTDINRQRLHNYLKAKWGTA